MDISALNIDLLLLGIAIASSLVLGFTVFFNNRKSSTHLFFLLFVVVSSAWGVLNYLSYQEFGVRLSLWIVRFVMFFAVYQAYLFLLLMLTFPKENLVFGKKLKLVTIVTVITSLLTLTPLVFSEVVINETGLPKPVPAPGIAVFAVVAISMVLGGIVFLIKRIFRSERKVKQQYLYLLFGVLSMFILIIVFNFYFVAVLGDSSLIPISGLFILPFTFFTYYAIARHKLLQIRIVGVELLVFALATVTLLEVIFSEGPTQILLRSFVFILILIFGVLLIRTISSEIKQREELEELTQKLRHLDKQKDEFVSMAAHELRAPMTAIKGYLSMVLEGDTGEIPPKARGYIADVRSITDRLTRLVNNMLNVSRIEEGRLVYQVEIISLSRVAQMVFAQFKIEAERKGLEMELQIPGDLKDTVKVDVDRIQEVMANIVSNAVKYTDDGKVIMRMKQASGDRVRFEVEDTGPGISQEEQQKLFQKFYRAESNVGKTIGTGLGLYICKLLIDNFNGTLGLRSEPGKGSTFWFELPIAKSKEGEDLSARSGDNKDKAN